MSGRSAPGLIKYGLHRDLESDTDDTDYEPEEEEEDDSWRNSAKLVKREDTSCEVSSSSSTGGSDAESLEVKNEEEGVENDNTVDENMVTESFNEESEEEVVGDNASPKSPLNEYAYAKVSSEKNGEQLVEQDTSSERTSHRNAAVGTSDKKNGKEIGKKRKRVKKKVLMKKVPKKKIELRKRPRKNVRRFGDVLKYSNDIFDSSDSDYVPDNTPKKEKTPGTKQENKEEVAASVRQEVVQHLHPPSNETWSLLPVEILTKILYLTAQSDDKGVRFICRCAQVCTQWYAFINQTIAWRYVDLAFLGGTKAAKEKLLINLVTSKFSECKELNLSGWTKVTDESLKCVAANCTRLESLNLSHCQVKSVSNITAPTLVSLAEKLPLKSINFSNLRISSSYGKSMVKVIELRGAHLTHINVSSNVAFGSAQFSAICEFCHELISLDVSNTSVRNISFDKLQNSCPKLQELYLTNLSLEPKNVSPDLCPGFPRLRMCSVARRSAIGWLSDQILLTILKTSHELVTLDVRCSDELSSDGLQIPSTKLERLYMSRCSVSVETVETICEKWSDTLWDLDLSWSESYRMNHDLLIARLVSGVKPCVHLTHLDLAGTSMSDSGVKIILRHCKDLFLLDLTSCRGVSRGLKRLHEGKEDILKLKKFYENLPEDKRLLFDNGMYV